MRAERYLMQHQSQTISLWMSATSACTSKQSENKGADKCRGNIKNKLQQLHAGVNVLVVITVRKCAGASLGLFISASPEELVA